MQRAVAIHALGEELGRDKAKLSITLLVRKSCFCASLLYEVPGGNLVDVLPPAASTGEDDIGPAPLPYKCMISTPLIAMCSLAFYNNDFSRSQKLRVVISFHFILVACP